jgi:putative ABC transport system substrate-binding protein
MARGQQGDRVRRVGVLMQLDENDPVYKPLLPAFTQGLADLGWTDGRDVRIDLRLGSGDINRTRALAHELVNLQPDIILAGGVATAAVQRETRTIPIVFVNVSDPVASGIVPRLDRPNGNITGFALFEPSLGGKWLELLTEIAPSLKRAAIMFNPDTAPVSAFMPFFEAAARSLKVEPIIAPVHSDVEIVRPSALGREPGGGLVVIPDVFTIGHRAPTISAAARNNVPAVYSQSPFATELSYGPNPVDNYRRAATYVDRTRREASRSPRSISDQVRVSREPQNGQGARPHHSGNAAGDSRRGNPVRRRQFIAGLGSAAAWPLAARGQQQAVPVIGFLIDQSADDDFKNVTVPFLQGLKETGYVEGRNVAIEYRYAENQFDRLPALAADLVRRRVAVIVLNSSEGARAAKAATTTIPIVFATGVDPVATGLVASLNRPGGNVTSSVLLSDELAPKRLQLVHELLPNAARFGVLVDPGYPDIQSNIKDLQAAARTLGLQLVILNARTDSDLEPPFATFSQQHVGAVLVGNSAFFNRRTEELAALAARHALPAIFPFREFVLAGGLMSYSGSLGYVWRQTGVYTGRVLKGEKPADLPVQQVTKIDLVINLKTAKALGLTIPETLLATADEVIQ